MSSATATEFIAHTADGRRFRAPQLLVAAGAWSNRMAEQFGEAVPMDARGPQMGVTEPLPYAIGPSIGVSSPVEHEGLYFRQIARGNIVFGGGLKGPADARRHPRLRRSRTTCCASCASCGAWCRRSSGCS